MPSMTDVTTSYAGLAALCVLALVVDFFTASLLRGSLFAGPPEGPP